MSVKEIQTAIVELPPGELANLLEWIEEYQSDAWDRQIAQDVEAGRFDALRPAPQDRYPLRGTPIQYRDPLEPVAEQDWEVLA